VNFHHSHNLIDSNRAGAERNFGIRVTLPESDTLSRILGSEWERLHWYASEQRRDEAFDAMAIRHGYYRESDSPTQVLEKINRQGS